MTGEWNKITREVQSFIEKWRSQGKRVWFRGHSCRSWQAKSSLHRHIEFVIDQAGVKNRFDSSQKRKILYEEYKTIYREFVANAWPLLTQDERSEWGVIFSMQHHGFPTQLLDWTESFACSVYFAQWQRNPLEDAAIYILIPEKMNFLSIGRESLVALHEDFLDADDISNAYHPKYAASGKDLQSIAVVPYFTNRRMVSQRSAFTLSGDTFDPLEQAFNADLLKNGYLKKIALPAEIYDETNRFLEIAGTSHYGYFPDFEGLVREFKEKTKRNIRYTKSFEKLANP